MARLAIEISNPAAKGAHADAPAAGGQVALEHAGLVLAETVAPASHAHDDLQPAIARLFARAGLRPADLQEVSVSVGPGGFTATRTACAAGQMIALATGAACVRVPSALVALYAHLQHDDGRPSDASRHVTRTVAVALASKGATAWFAIFEPGRSSPPSASGTQLATASDSLITGSALVASAFSGRVLDAAGLLECRPALVLADAFLPATIGEALAHAGVPKAPIRFSALACLHAASVCPRVAGHELLPLYPRQPEAVTLWQARKRASNSTPPTTSAKAQP